MKKSELKDLIKECINEERKSKTDKVQEKWQILAKLIGGKEYKSKWYTDWNDAYDALGPFVQDLDKKHGHGNGSGNNLSTPTIFDYRYMKSNKE